MLKILVDENIPFARQAFGTLGEVRMKSGRAITRAALDDIEALIVRSITTVDDNLLHDTPVRFVGTATIGVDHLDLAYLQASQIAYASASGSNANSVAEYVVAALLHWAVQHHRDLRGQTLGLVGRGNVGSRVLHKVQALGMTVLINDPPLARATPARPPYQFLPLDELMQADFITLHTPLLTQGPDRTSHLFDEARLQAMKRGSVLINTARGAVVDNAALRQILQQYHLADAILDVWESEPHPDPALLRASYLATPHIAGYSFDGKLQGTVQIYNALCQFLNVPATWQATAEVPVLAEPMIATAGMQGDDMNVLHQIVQRAYDLSRDDQALRQGFAIAATEAQRGRHFEELRRTYPVRREFANYTVLLDQHAHLANVLQELGFVVQSH